MTALQTAQLRAIRADHTFEVARTNVQVVTASDNISPETMAFCMARFSDAMADYADALKDLARHTGNY